MYKFAVALFTRAWIEIPVLSSTVRSIASSPFSRGRGLKLNLVDFCNARRLVALFTRAWIEITPLEFVYTTVYVALFTRAWIEIAEINRSARCLLSPFSRGRGLKLCHNQHLLHRLYVALFTRAWIEMPVRYGRGSTYSRRPFHEGVD